MMLTAINGTVTATYPRWRAFRLKGYRRLFYCRAGLPRVGDYVAMQVAGRTVLSLEVRG